MENQSKKRIFAVLGAGKQGTAAAYDFLRFADPDAVWMADSRAEVADGSAERLRALVPEKADRVFAAEVDASDTVVLSRFLEPVHTLLSAVPYFMHPQVAEAAI